MKLRLLIKNQVQHLLVALGRLFGFIDFPVPPSSSMLKTSSRLIRHYYISSIQTSLPIITEALKEGVKLREPISILDFGCGVGRQLLHFTRHFPAPRYYACDIDDTSVQFIIDNYKNVDAYTNNFKPPLKYPDQSFDMIYSISIFSHLSTDDQAQWLKELARVCKKGAYCFLTTEGITALKKLTSAFGADEETLMAELNKSGVLFREYQLLKHHVEGQNTMRIAAQLVGVTGSYGNTIMSPDYIKQNWASDYFEVVNIIEGIIDYRQDLVVLRRK